MEFIKDNVSIAEIKCAVDNKDGKIFLYGAGDGASSYAKIVLPAMESFGLKPTSFIDDDKNRWGTIYEGYEIKSLSDAMSYGGEKFVFISSNYFESIAKNLVPYKQELSVFTCSQILTDASKEVFCGVMEYEEVQRRIHIHASKYRRIMNLLNDERNLHLNIVDIQVTERCTMKCKDCSNLMQYYTRPKNTESSHLDMSVARLLGAIDELSEARILGGEPFLYKQLPSVIKILQENEKVKKIFIYTNATFLPKEPILTSLVDHKTFVEITDYNMLSGACQEMVEAFQGYGIQYISHSPQDWTDSARIVNVARHESTLAEMFSSCCVNDVLTLLHGRLYHCPFSANAHNLDAIPTEPDDYVDVCKSADHGNLRQAIKAFYFGRGYLTACKSCLGRDYTQKKVEPAIQVKRAIPLEPLLTRA